MLYVYRFLWPLHLGWLLVCCLYKEVYLQIFKYVSFWLHGCCGNWKGWARKPVNHTSWVAVVTQTDRPKSVRNRCVIELFCGAVCVVSLPVLHICWCRGFCYRNESDLFLFLLQFKQYEMPSSEFKTNFSKYKRYKAHPASSEYEKTFWSTTMHSGILRWPGITPANEFGIDVDLRTKFREVHILSASIAYFSKMAKFVC